MKKIFQLEKEKDGSNRLIDRTLPVPRTLSIGNAFVTDASCG